MSTQAPFALRGRNPDILTSIANLSNDEVFTPPEFANRMLETLEEAWANSNDGANIWADSSVTFLDPFTKSGVFLREITKRLVDGLQGEIPNLQDRVNHVLTKQVFGIGITELTSLLARRSVYCSKWANGEHSICTAFDNEQGNIWYERTEHTWVGGTEKVITMDENGEAVLKPTNGKCKFCGANQKEYDRDDVLETHAYPFIHTHDIKTRIAELFGEEMKFDVIIGNPPYQLSDGGNGASAMPIYQKFIEQAEALEPSFLSMVVPARWYAGGRGLGEFRKHMLSDPQIRILVDYPNSRDCFAGVDVAGGICYFLWHKGSTGTARIVSMHNPEKPVSQERPLNQFGVDVFVRFNEAVSIIQKISQVEKLAGETPNAKGRRFSEQVSQQKPFGLRTYFRGEPEKSSVNEILVLQSGGQGWTSREQIGVGVELIDRWKVFTSKSSSEHAGQSDREGRRRVLSLTGVLPPGSVVTETYVQLGSFETELEARNCLSYVQTNFFRFLIAARSSGQDISRSAYDFIPIQDFSKAWTDAELYEKYGLTKVETSFIDSLIRPMELSSE